MNLYTTVTRLMVFKLFYINHMRSYQLISDYINLCKIIKNHESRYCCIMNPQKDTF